MRQKEMTSSCTEGGLDLDMRKNFFIERVAKH